MSTAELLFLLIFYLRMADVNSLCTCSVASGTLTCDTNTIHSFPEDMSDCNIDPLQVSRIHLYMQPLQKVGDYAFSDFTEASRISLTMNEALSELSETTFFGLNKLRGLFLHTNIISNIPKGMLDSLVALNELDVELNPIESPYVTNVWYFCNQLAVEVGGLEIKGDLAVEKQLYLADYSEEYCRVRSMVDPQSHIIEECGEQTTEGVLTCLQSEDIAKLACEIQDHPADRILFEFKNAGYEGSETRIVDDFRECETDEFFRSFNSNNQSAEATAEMRLMKSLTLYVPKFDLSDLAGVTGKMTERVTIHADTVFLSGTLIEPLNHTLIIRARKVILDHPIPMIMPKSAFVLDGSRNVPIEPFALSEEIIVINEKLTMRRRRYGLVDILDAVAVSLPATSRQRSYRGCFPDKPEKPEHNKGLAEMTDHELADKQTLQTAGCVPHTLEADAANVDTSDWYDVTSVNLNYVCARTLLSSQANNQLVRDIANFSLEFASRKEIIHDAAAFTASQKFKRVLEMADKPFIHNVPVYSIGDIGDMAQILHSQMSLYYATELSIESQIASASTKMTLMNTCFEIVELNQQRYFEDELRQLEIIFSFYNSTWNANFEHREVYKDQIQSNMEAILNMTYEMKEEEYKQMLHDAQDSVLHMNDTVTKYEEDVNRYMEAANKSIELQQNQIVEARETGQIMSDEFDAFEIAVQDYEDEMQKQRTRGIFGGLARIGIGLCIGYFDPCAFMDVVALCAEGIQALMGDLGEATEIIEEIDQWLADLNLDDLLNISLNITTDFSAALNNAYDLKDKASDFDEIEALASIQLDYFDDLTNHEIAGMNDLMYACTNFANSCQRLVVETSDFADKMLLLAEKNGDLELARKDLVRAEQQVLDIERMIQDLETIHNEYLDQMNQSEEAYESAVDDLEEAFVNATNEQLEAFEQDITEKYNAYVETFEVVRSSYLTQMSNLMTSLQQKRYGLKEHSMVQRSMVMSLFVDYCDAKFYYAFESCEEEVPTMSDEFGVILENLISIQWNAAISAESVPGGASNFWDEVTLVDDATARDFPVRSLKDTGKLEVNLLRYMGDTYDIFWRVRITKIKLILLDVSGEYLPSPLGEDTEVIVQYPKMFNDTDLSHDRHLFLAQSRDCDAYYVTTPGENEIRFKSCCHINEDFQNLNYQTSLDGLFTFTLLNADSHNLDQLGSLIIRFEGSRVLMGAASFEDGMGSTYHRDLKDVSCDFGE